MGSPCVDGRKSVRNEGVRKQGERSGPEKEVWEGSGISLEKVGSVSELARRAGAGGCWGVLSGAGETGTPAWEQGEELGK